MNTITSKPRSKQSLKLRSTVFSLLDAEIKYADFKLNAFTKSLMKSNQHPRRANLDVTSVLTTNDRVFTIIENSSLHTTKLLYLRSNLTDWNAKRILYLLTQKDIKEMSLDELKKFIK